MSPEISSLLLAVGIFAVGFVSIGPNILAIIGTSMERGRAEGVQLALGVGTGTCLWATMTVAGLTALITAYAGLVLILKIFGVLYLLWLAFKAFKSAATPAQKAAPTALKGGNLFLRGLTVQMTNPKAALQWIAIVAIGLGPDAPLWTGVILIVLATGLSLAAHVLYAVTFSTAPVVAFYQKARRAIEAALGVFFAFAAFKIATYRP
ncbi:MAG: LysE family translocator [Pseudomonadota bacterium]